jgi:hypothetical protein
MAAHSVPNPRSRALRVFAGQLGRSRFFTISVALHFLFVLVFGSVVLVKQVTPRTDFDDATGSLVGPSPSGAEAVQPMTAQADGGVSSMPAASSSLAGLNVLTTLPAVPSAFTLPSAPLAPPVNARSFGMPASAGPQSEARPAPSSYGGIPAAQARSMKEFTSSWAAGKDLDGGAGKDRVFKFTAYLARYAGGDWDSTVRIAAGHIAKGSLPNLLFLIRKWSANKIDATPEAVPLDIATNEIFARKPPFIFFTGHRDFVLTGEEVRNLQQYLQLGGAIWGDSSLPGRHSRFDIAFRREMKRVLPDANAEWEALPPEHPIYTQGYFPEIRQPPPGMNYYQEPAYALRMFGEIAVLYTANDYGDMMQVGLTERSEVDLGQDASGNYLTTNWEMYSNRNAYFRNLDAKPVADSYKFGINVILHLLTRWENKLRDVPVGL